MKKKILVTGCAGFIGSALAKKLVEKNYNVYGIDNLTTGKKSSIPKKVKFIKGNCENDKILNKIKDINFQIIFHFAGQSSGEMSFYDPIKDLNSNFYSTAKLLSYAQKIKCKHFIYASSMSVYGDVGDKPVSENHICVPKSFYGASKLASENYIRIFKNKKVNSTILRIFNAYGPGQNLENSKQGMLSIYLDQIFKKKKIILRGSKNRSRDFIYIEDVVNIVLKIMGNKKCFNKTLNIGSGKKYKIYEIINKMKQISKINFSVTYMKSTPLDQFYIYPNINKLKNLLKIKIKNSVDEGLHKFVYFLENIYK